MLRVLLSTLLATTLGAAAVPAQAGDRYASPPPLVLSPDLASPWMLQLRGAPRRTTTVQPARVATRRAVQPRPIKRHKAVSSVQTRRSGTVTLARHTGPSPSIHQAFDQSLLPATVSWSGGERPGTIVVDTPQRRLFLVQEGGKARRYAVGVGKPGFEWAGSHKVTRKAQWPSWRPPEEMIERERKKGRELPAFMEGGPKNPLGARALYLGSSIYRIHGTNQDWSIGKAVSSGCIRMRNEDVMDLYQRVGVGTLVKVI